MNTNKSCDIQNVDAEKGDFSKNLQKSIETIIEKEGFITHNIYKRMISTEGGNYMGELHEVDIKGKTVDGDKETNIFIKKVLPNAEDNMKDVFSITDVYSIEIYAYTELARIFTGLQDDANVPKEDRFKMVKGYEESSTEAIILENMAKKGFRTGHRMNMISLKFAELSIEQLAKFHALAFVLENRKPYYFEKKIVPLKYPYRWDDTWKITCRNMMMATVRNVEDAELRKKAEDFIQVALDKYPKYYNYNQTSIRCLCHGDFRANNILMKEVDGEVTEVIPVDYQVMYYGCPVNDFIYFIFLGTDRKFREEHLENLKDLYYNTLIRFLAYFDMEGEKVFPKKLYDNMFKERLDLGLIIATNIGGFLFAEEGQIFNMDDGAFQEWKPKYDVRFQNWFREIFEDCTGCNCL